MNKKQTEKIDQSYWGIVKRQFKKNRMAVWSLRMVYVIMFIGIMADFIANDKPFFCRINGNSYFPILKSYGVALGIAKYPPELSNVNWSEVKYDFVIRTPIPYSPQNLDLKNKDYKSPLDDQDVESSRWRHHLGTDNLGRDVLAGMVHGTRTAMLVGIISMSISIIIGIFFGALAGYFGDKGMQMSRGRFWLSIIGFLLGGYYAFGVRGYFLSKALSEGMGGFLIQLIYSLVILIGIFAIFNGIAILIKRIPFFGKKVNVPVDILVSRLIEVKVSIPTLLLILSIVAVMSRPNILMVMVIIGFTSWTGIAKYTRAELLKVRSLEFIQAAQSLGYSELRTIFKHALPNSLSSVLVAIAFGVAGAILLESSLSFLGIGMRPEDVTWGSMLSSARGYFKAWWLAIIPGFAIFITVTVFNLLGEGLTDAMDPRLKQ
ncbi:MAG: ABC transporter permease [Chitinophagales bacterium]|nr:ABC transporter permease [Chitinophagales bacterium]